MAAKAPLVKRYVVRLSAEERHQLEAMRRTVSPSTSRCYGLARVSRAWSVSRAGVYRSVAAVRRKRPAMTIDHARALSRRAGAGSSGERG
jgi:hypothetical protein